MGATVPERQQQLLFLLLLLPPLSSTGLERSRLLSFRGTLTVDSDGDSDCGGDRGGDARGDECHPHRG